MGFAELLTVKGLFPSFTKGGVRVDDGWDQLNRIHMVGLMILMGTVVTVRVFMGNIIKCYGFQTFGTKTDFADDYCWTQGIYTIKEAYDLPRLNVPYPGLIPEDIPPCIEVELVSGGFLTCPDASEIKPPTRIYHLWYQWVPFYFFLVALAYYVPYVMSKTCGMGEIKKVAAMVHNTIEDEDGLEKTENKVVNWLHFTFKTYIESSGLAKLSHRHKLALLIFMTKLFYLLLSIWSFYMTAQMFEIGDFMTYGKDWSLANDNESTLIKDKIFPKMVACEIKRWGPSGLEEEQGMCVLAPNVVNQYLFLILWFCMVFVIVTNILSVLIYSIVWAPLGIFCTQFSYMKFTKAALMKPNTPDLRNVYDSVGASGRVILHILAQNTKPQLFQNIINKLIKKLSNPIKTPLVGPCVMIQELDECVKC